MADLCKKFGLDLDSFAVANLDKVKDRWRRSPHVEPFDRAFLDHEQLPRRARIEFQLRELPRTSGERTSCVTDRYVQLVGLENGGYECLRKAVRVCAQATLLGTAVALIWWSLSTIISACRVGKMLSMPVDE